MKFSKAFIAKTVARISDILTTEPNQDAANQQYLPGLEDQAVVDKATKALHEISYLEDKVWESIENQTNRTKLDDYSAREPEDYDYESYMESYQEQFYDRDGSMLARFLKNMDDSDLEDLETSYLEQLVEYSPEKWSDVVTTELFNNTEFATKFIDEIADVSYDNEEFINTLIANFKPKFEDQYGPNRANHIFNVDQDNPKHFKQLMLDCYKSDPNKMASLIMNNTELFDEQIKDVSLRDMRSTKKILSANDLQDDFEEWCYDTEPIDESTIDSYIMSEYRNEMDEAISESNYEYVREETGREIMNLLDHISKGKEVELNELYEVDDFFNNNNVSAQFSEHDSWVENVTPEILKVRNYVDNLDPDVYRVIENKFPQSSPRDRQNSTNIYQLEKALGREPEEPEIKEFNDPASRGYYLQIIEKYKKVYGVAPSFGAYKKITMSIELIRDLENKYKQTLSHEQAIDYDQNLKQRQEEEKQREQEILKQKEFNDYKTKVEKPVIPVEGDNQSLVMNLVNKVKQKGSIGKQELQNFFAKYKK